VQFQDPSSGKYEQKMTRFVMRQRLGKSKKKVGEVELDLAEYATMEEVCLTLTLSLSLTLIATMSHPDP